MSAIDEAKKIIEAHEGFSEAGDVEGVLGNMHDDAAFLAADMPMVEGREAVRGLYEALFAMGTWRFRHDYSSATEHGELVLLHGVARGTLTPDGGEPSPLANNFMITMRRMPDGGMKLWRAAFAPSGE